MDSHEKLGNLLSEYLNSEEPAAVPEEVVSAFHQLGLTEFATRQNVNDTYREKCNQIEQDKLNAPSSRFASDYASQQKKELDEAYAAITSWLDKKV